MARFREEAPQPDPALLPFLNSGVIEIVAEISEGLNKFDPHPFGVVPNFLTEDGLRTLEQLQVPTNGKCSEDVLMAHPVAGPLARTMGNISLANMDLRHNSTQIAHSLKNESGENLVLEAHRDLLDGHAVLFNYAVSGDLTYELDGESYPLNNNELVILNGAAIWGDITNFLPGEEDSDPRKSWRTLGGVTMTHAVMGRGYTSRNRLLVYANGRDTVVTQIPPQLPPWF